MAKEIDILPQINNLMEEYKMLTEYKIKMENKVNKLDQRVLDLTKNLKMPKHAFVANMEANIISVEKEIKDTIIQMKNIKKEIIDLTMKEYKLDNDDESEDKFNELSKAMLKQLNNMNNTDIISQMAESDNEDNEDDSLDKLNSVLDNLEDQTEEERKEDIKEELNQEVDELNQQDLKSVLNIYKNQLNFFVLGEDESEYELAIADNDMNIIEDDELKEEYPQLYSLTRDLIFEEVEGQEDLVKDEFGNLYQKAEY